MLSPKVKPYPRNPDTDKVEQTTLRLILKSTSLFNRRFHSDPDLTISLTSQMRHPLQLPGQADAVQVIFFNGRLARIFTQLLPFIRIF